MSRREAGWLEGPSEGQGVRCVMRTSTEGRMGFKSLRNVVSPPHLRLWEGVVFVVKEALGR